MQKQHTKNIQELLDDTNQRLQKMETEYSQQSSATVSREPLPRPPIPPDYPLARYDWSLPKRAGSWVRINAAKVLGIDQNSSGDFQIKLPHHHSCCVPDCTNSHNCNDVAFLLVLSR